jgi:hypothetical protein
MPVADRILVPSLPENLLSSTGLEAERYIGLLPVRLPVVAGSFDEDALLFDLEARGWRLLVTAEAIGSWVVGDTKWLLTVSTPRYMR